MTENEIAKRRVTATDTFMDLVENEIDTLRQKLAEAEAKIRILQENAGALVDRKAELEEANRYLADEIKRLQGMDIQQNQPAVFAALRHRHGLSAEAREELEKSTDNVFAELKHPSNVGLLKMTKNIAEEAEKRAAQILNEGFAKIEKGG